ncbi:MAG: hypothetical protein BWY66_00233 [bacterium ADurb.Bin374]|nr:MAG: hypothetical protein BWY66_00233 [bacterium ADurb.Bin374]
MRSVLDAGQRFLKKAEGIIRILLEAPDAPDLLFGSIVIGPFLGVQHPLAEFSQAVDFPGQLMPGGGIRAGRKTGLPEPESGGGVAVLRQGDLAQSQPGLVAPGRIGIQLQHGLVILAGLRRVLQRINVDACALEQDFLAVGSFHAFPEHVAELGDGFHGPGVLRPDLALPEEFGAGIDERDLVEQVLGAVFRVLAALDQPGKPEQTGRCFGLFGEQLDLPLDLFDGAEFRKLVALFLDPQLGLRHRPDVAVSVEQFADGRFVLVLARLLDEPFERREPEFFLARRLESVFHVIEIVGQLLESQTDLAAPGRLEGERGLERLDRLFLFLVLFQEGRLADRRIDPHIRGKG